MRVGRPIAPRPSPTPSTTSGRAVERRHRRHVDVVDPAAGRRIDQDEFAASPAKRSSRAGAPGERGWGAAHRTVAQGRADLAGTPILQVVGLAHLRDPGAAVVTFAATGALAAASG